MTDTHEKLRHISTFPSLIKFLREDLDWPIESDDFEDLTFDYTPEELGIDPASAAKIDEIKRMRRLAANQPWGIFFVKFEPKQLPVVALRRILNSVVAKKRATASSAEQQKWATDDLLFISNYGEDEERRISFAHFSQDPTKDHLPTLKVLAWDDLDTPLHLEHAASTLVERLSWPNSEDEWDDESWRDRWSSAFELRHREVITTSKVLAERLALLARAIRHRILGVLEIETDEGPVTRLMQSFRDALVHDLDAAGFADMYAQTIAYGLLSARIANPKANDGVEVQLPVTNPFLKELMETFLHLGGGKAKGRGTAIDFDELGVREVAGLLGDPNTKMEAIVRDFGDRNRQEDPVIHFYELFLKAYDAEQKISRGVFYTPQPVVSFIVRSVHERLQTEFGLTDGLADTATWGEMAERQAGLEIPEGVRGTDRFVTVLDPATGTGTFLVEAIDVIHRTLREKWSHEGHGEKQILDLWNDYVHEHLLPRLHGYELLMAPYAIAHLKIGLKLLETGYRFQTNQRARIYLTNALEPAHDFSGQFEFAVPALAHEAKAVNEVKRDQRFTVVIGNPPYANFGQQNRIPAILTLLDDYKRGLNERKLNLDDDFIKFIRFGQSLIEQSRNGVLAFISNNTYIDGITHRRMREALSVAFSKIDVLDLHGSYVKRGRAAEDSRDENVFEIQQGVAIAIFVCLSHGDTQHVKHASLRGSREQKYDYLSDHTVSSTAWTEIHLTGPNFFFVPKNFMGQEEYQRFVSIRTLMPIGTSATQTKRDALFIDFDARSLADRMKELLESGPTAEMAKLYPLEESAGWSPSRLRGVQYDARNVRPYLYRPFDNRAIYYDDRILGRSRITVFQHLLRPNIAIATLRQTVDDGFRHVFCTTELCDINLTIGHHVSDQVFPLYLYGSGDQGTLDSERTPNLSEPVVRRISSALELRWTDDEQGDLQRTLGPRDIFDYVYALLHSPGYRARYVEFLKIDFPRLPVALSLELFGELTRLGGELVAMHLIEAPAQRAVVSLYDKGAKAWRYEVANGQRLPVSLSFNGPAEPVVERVGWSGDTVWLDAVKSKKGGVNATVSGSVGFSPVPEEIWNFRIGGYQVCEKWLKDRGPKKGQPGRVLTADDIAHYHRIVIALHETIRIMGEIDEVIEEHGGWPDAFMTSDGIGLQAESDSDARAHPARATV
jgi:hypothetical protein